MSAGPGLNDLQLALFRAHMFACMQAVLAPMSPDAKVTIIVRAPESSPSEAVICTNDSMALVRDAVAHAAEVSGK
jgi:hypothetical protein